VSGAREEGARDSTLGRRERVVGDRRGE